MNADLLALRVGEDGGGPDEGSVMKASREKRREGLTQRNSQIRDREKIFTEKEELLKVKKPSMYRKKTITIKCKALPSRRHIRGADNPRAPREGKEERWLGFFQRERERSREGGSHASISRQHRFDLSFVYMEESQSYISCNIIKMVKTIAETK